MPPPPPRQTPQLLYRGSKQQSDELLPSSEDSDIDIDDTSPNQDGATAAWIQKQLQCPEPFLTAPQLLSAKAARTSPAPHRYASGFGAAKLPAAPAVAAHSRALRHSLGQTSGQNTLCTQAPKHAASLCTQMPPLLPAFPLASALASQASVASVLAQAQQRRSIASGAMPSAQLQLPRATASAHVVPGEQRFHRYTASRGADVGVGLKAGRHGHKPPLYPAKRAHGEEAEARHLEPKQQAQLRMSMLPRAQNISGGRLEFPTLLGIPYFA